MSEIQAAVLRAKLSYLDGWNAERKSMADEYRRVGIQSIAGDISSWHLFPVMVPNAHDARADMHTRGVDVGVHYPYTLPPFHGNNGMYPNAETIAAQHMTLPIGPGYNEEELQYVIQVYTEASCDPQYNS